MSNKEEKVGGGLSAVLFSIFSACLTYFIIITKTVVTVTFIQQTLIAKGACDDGDTGRQDPCSPGVYSLVRLRGK